MSQISILGGGIAGISAAYHAKLNNKAAVVYEANSKPGGLVSNFMVDGFRFDHAIHMSFTKSEYVREIFDRTEYYSHPPDAYCFENGKWMKHPVQNNLSELSTEDKVKLISSFFERPTGDPSNYKEWLYSQYGKEIAERYPLAYTRKYWGVEAERLSLNWIGNRMRKSDIAELLRGAFEKRNDNHYYTGEMRYPKRGGYFSFIEKISKEVNIFCNKKLVRLDPVQKKLYFSDGGVELYDSVVSTLPLPTIANMIDGVPGDVMEAANSLLWTTVDLISIGFSKTQVPPHLWFYIYGEECPAARGYSPSWKSPDNAPEGCSSLQFEIYNISTRNSFDGSYLKAEILKNLIDMNICNQADIIFMHHKHVPFGNVVFDHGMEERRQVVLDYLASHNIVTAGRFGEWDYFWSDQSFLSGRSAIERI